MSILIKRYANRKLYNTDTSRYITLKGVAQLLDQGEEVRVIDNESGDDITQVALSQILVDNKRSNEDPSDTLLSQILNRGGDALYSAIRKSVDEASDGIGDFQERFRHFVNQAEALKPPVRGFGWDRHATGSASDAAHEAAGERNPSARTSASTSGPSGSAGMDPGKVDGKLADLVQEAVASAFAERDLPTQRDVERLNRNLERVADALEQLAPDAPLRR